MVFKHKVDDQAEKDGHTGWLAEADVFFLWMIIVSDVAFVVLLFTLDESPIYVNDVISTMRLHWHWMLLLSQIIFWLAAQLYHYESRQIAKGRRDNTESGSISEIFLSILPELLLCIIDTRVVIMVYSCSINHCGLEQPPIGPIIRCVSAGSALLIATTICRRLTRSSRWSTKRVLVDDNKEIEEDTKGHYATIV